MVDRITLLLKTKNITASQFADEVGVQRSSVSHVLSGRNKPSLDFIQKILKKYPEINPDWLLFGKGAMNMEFNLFSEISDAIPLQEEVIDKALKRQERPMRAVPEKILPDEDIEADEEVFEKEILTQGINLAAAQENSESLKSEPISSIHSETHYSNIQTENNQNQPIVTNIQHQAVIHPPQSNIATSPQTFTTQHHTNPPQQTYPLPQELNTAPQQVFQPQQAVNSTPQQVFQPQQVVNAVPQQAFQQPQLLNTASQQAFQQQQPDSTAPQYSFQQNAGNISPQATQQNVQTPMPAIPATGKEIEQIMVFYKDKTFTVYKPE